MTEAGFGAVYHTYVAYATAHAAPVAIARPTMWRFDLHKLQTPCRVSQFAAFLALMVHTDTR
jgi:hypothetical protein